MVSKNQEDVNSGTALITGSLLLIVTMVLHPAGGSFQHLAKSVSIIIVSHSIALLSVPFILIGFRTLTKRLSNEGFLADISFILMVIGIFAAVSAIALNGLALPLFVNRFQNASDETIDSLKPILIYNTVLNKAFDLIYITGSCLAMVFWSVAIVRIRLFPRWSGWLGIAIGLSAVIALFSGFIFTNLTGFRIFILGFVSWSILIGVLLKNNRAASHTA